MKFEQEGIRFNFNDPRDVPFIYKVLNTINDSMHHRGDLRLAKPLDGFEQVEVEAKAKVGIPTDTSLRSRIHVAQQTLRTIDPDIPLIVKPSEVEVLRNMVVLNLEAGIRENGTATYSADFQNMLALYDEEYGQNAG